MNSKQKCSTCGSKSTKKYGFQPKTGKQRYYCNLCKKYFGIIKPLKSSIQHSIINQYLYKGKSIESLARDYKCTTLELKQKICTINIIPPESDSYPVILKLFIKKINKKAIRAITYDSNTNKLVGNFFIADHQSMKNLELQHRIEKVGYKVNAIITKDIQYAKKMFPGLPVQICNYYQETILEKYLTKEALVLDRQKMKGLFLGLTYFDLTNENFGSFCYKTIDEPRQSKINKFEYFMLKLIVYQYLKNINNINHSKSEREVVKIPFSEFEKYDKTNQMSADRVNKSSKELMTRLQFKFPGEGETRKINVIENIDDSNTILTCELNEEVTDYLSELLYSSFIENINQVLFLDEFFLFNVKNKSTTLSIIADYLSCCNDVLKLSFKVKLQNIIYSDKLLKIPENNISPYRLEIVNDVNDRKDSEIYKITKKMCKSPKNSLAIDEVKRKIQEARNIIMERLKMFKKENN